MEVVNADPLACYWYKGLGPFLNT